MSAEPELDVTVELARRLVDRQAPEFRDDPLTRLSSGWDNVMFRLGADHIVRLPHRAEPAALIGNEQRWLGDIAELVAPVEVPVPIHIGRPDDDLGYPWAWSIVPWIEGTEAATADFDGAALARQLGDFFAALHRPAPSDAPHNPYRSGAVEERRRWFDERLTRIADQVDAAALQRVFDRGARAEQAARPVLIHGDFHARNVIVDGDRLAAVIDWIDICASDPAVDLSGAFSVVPAHLDIVQAAVEADDATWNRAAAWAAYFAITYLALSTPGSPMLAVGRRLAATVVETCG